MTLNYAEKSFRNLVILGNVSLGKHCTDVVEVKMFSSFVSFHSDIFVSVQISYLPTLVLNSTIIPKCASKLCAPTVTAKKCFTILVPGRNYGPSEPHPSCALEAITWWMKLNVLRTTISVTSEQSYKGSTIVNYGYRVVIRGIFKSEMSLES